MSLDFGTSVYGVQTLVNEAVREHDRIVLGINENAGGLPERVGYGYVIARDYTTTAEYLFWRGALYIPGLYLPLPPAQGNLFAAIRVVVDWDKPDIPWFLSA